MAARRNKKFITTEEIEQSLLKVVMGVEKRTRIVSNEDQKLTAYHEAGHAIAFHALPTQDPVHHVTIIPRSNGAGGFTMPLPKEDNEYRTRRYMEEHLIVCLAGRVAEEIFMDDISTGAYGDIKQATAMARAMVINYGFSDKIGPIDYDAQNEEIFLGRDFAASNGYSEAKAAEIDEEIHRLIQEANTRCRKLLEENREQMVRVAEYLRRNETIDGDVFRKLYDGEDVPDRKAPSENELRGAHVDVTIKEEKEQVLETGTDIPPVTTAQTPVSAQDMPSEQATESKQDAEN